MGVEYLPGCDARRERRDANSNGQKLEAPARILFVDDDDTMRCLIIDILTEKGHLVIGAADCEVARQLLASCVFDLVLLDVALPDGTGFDILEFISQNELSTNVIMLTGTAGLDNAIRGASHGVLDYIAKPFSPDYLVRSIDHALAATNQN